MFAHYLTLARRHLWRHRALSLIHIGGLSVGLASGLIIFLVVNYMFSFDRYHPHLDRSYWIVTDVKNERTMPTDAAPRPLADVLRRDYPFVESAVRLETFFGRTISVPDGKGGWAKKFGEARNLCFTEPQYSDLFGVEWVSGDPKTALAAPNTIVLSERYARKYFDGAPALGRTLRLDNRTNLVVTGIIKNPPANTQLRYDALVSYATIPILEGPAALNDWQGLQAMCFVLLREGTDPVSLNRVLPAIRQQHLPPTEAGHFDYQVLPLEDLNHERSGTAPRPILYALITVGVLLVLAACINYINLATAQALQRLPEIGVRKAIGSTRRQLIGQFLFETALLTLMAVGVALVLTQLCLPLVNQTLAGQIEMLQPDLSVLDLLQTKAIGWFIALVAGVILLAGFYPAFIQATTPPKTALAGRVAGQTGRGLTVRRGLITTQFFIAQLFIIGVLVIIAQLRHLQTVDWGFHHDATLTVWLPPKGPAPLPLLRQRWLGIPGVEQVTFGSDPPASPLNRPSSFSFHTATEPEAFETRLRAIDAHYLAAFDLGLVAGRNVQATDTTGREVLVNETLVRQLGVSSANAVVGKRVRVQDADRTIVGVVRDFRSGNLHQPILPVTLIPDASHSHTAMLRLAPNHSPETLRAIQQIWNETLPDEVYRTDFLSNLLTSFTEIERLMAGLVQAFALVAIAMSCLGMYGLVTFLIEAKAKEIGVRRVLGAQSGQLLGLFGRELGKLLLLSFILAAPLGWWLMGGWLQQYAHRISVSGWLLMATLSLTTLTTGLTVFRAIWKAVVANPVRYLKDE